MPLLTPSDSTQLSMSTVRQFLAASGNTFVSGTNSNLSLSAMELYYMGNVTSGTGAIVSDAKVCMWRQIEVASPAPTGGATSNPGFSPGVGAWNYTGGTGVPWRPSRFSEFQRAYYAPPSAVGYGVPTGATNSTGIIRFSFAGGSPAAFGSGRYFLYLTSGTIGSGWYSTTSSTLDFGCNNGGNATAYVVDDRYCGGQMVGNEIRVTGSISYP